jgi:hypothetical protein
MSCRRMLSLLAYLQSFFQFLSPNLHGLRAAAAFS